MKPAPLNTVLPDTWAVLTTTALQQVAEHVFKTGARVLIRDVGVFVVRTRKARRIRNPQTGALMRLPATKSLGLVPVKATRRRGAK